MLKRSYKLSKQRNFQMTINKKTEKFYLFKTIKYNKQYIQKITFKLKK